MNQPSTNPQHITVKRIDVPFLDWVGLLIKIAFASIPAAFIVGMFMMIFSIFFGAFFRALL